MIFQVRQRIHKKNQALFSSKDKSKKFKCCLLQFLFGALRVKAHTRYSAHLLALLFHKASIDDIL